MKRPRPCSATINPSTSSVINTVRALWRVRPNRSHNSFSLRKRAPGRPDLPDRSSPRSSRVTAGRSPCRPVRACPAASQTNQPEPGADSISPRSASKTSAVRTVPRETEYRFARTASESSALPGGSAPASMPCTTAATIRSRPGAGRLSGSTSTHWLSQPTRLPDRGEPSADPPCALLGRRKSYRHRRAVGAMSCAQYLPNSTNDTP
jgi:hypothetical protein